METEARSKKTYRNKTMGIVAHRGFWNCEEAGFAKNSVAGLRCAQENGFWGSEFDVNMTSDGELIVYHDSKIDGKLIEKYPYSEFKDITIANGEKIPTIDEYLEQGKKYPETMLVYEMKPHSCDEVEDRFVELTIAKLKEHELLDPERVMFISFSYHICKRMAEELPGFTVQYLNGEKSPAKVKKDGINGIDYNYKIFNLNPKWATKAKKLDMSTNAWTVNKVENMKQVIDHGVMYITTDYPLEARKVIKEEGLEEIR
jgi:glycerophosphoryl diester phosphodiesterase